MTSKPIDRIRVEDRHRSDVGDLTGLRESISNVGLLHPIVITPDGRLIAGQRRLEACRQLGWTEVPTREVSHLSQARQWLEAERDENVCRLDMRPSEKVALGLALEELERPAAAERKAATQAQPGNRVGEENFPSPTKGDRTGKVYDLVGEAIGMSGPTYKRAKAVVREAEAGDPVAVEALEVMDATGKVTPAYEKITGKTNGVYRDGSRKRSPDELVQRVIEKLRDTVAALEHIDTATAVSASNAPLAQWDDELTAIIRPLHQLRGSIREVTSP